jgi:hypothetical protein
MKELIRKILKEERTNPIKKFFFDHWDEMRSEGEYPTIDYSLIAKLGFRKRAIEIHDYYLVDQPTPSWITEDIICTNLETHLKTKKNDD